MIFWLCCKQRQHSYQFSWGLNSLQLTSDDPSVLATAMLVPPWCDTKGQHWCPQRHQAQVSSLCPHGRPGACPKATAILAAWCTCQPHENQPLAHLHHPQSPVAEVVLYHTKKKAKTYPKISFNPLDALERKPKVMFLTQFIFITCTSGDLRLEMNMRKGRGKTTRHCTVPPPALYFL